ncbi:MAG: NAD-dependent epimerase/dehydratase family protein, partial [Acidobacteriota bacterium]
MPTPPSSKSPAPDSPATARQKALVTGASGFIGRHVLERLERAGVEVHATTRSIPGPDLPSSAAWHRLDLTDGDAVGGLVKDVRPHHVYHLASHVAGSRDLSLVGPTFEGNFVSTLRLLSAAA